MKNQFYYFIYIALFFITSSSIAQVTTVVDISTGVSSNGALLPVNSAIPYNSVDPKWQCFSRIGTFPGTLDPMWGQQRPCAISNGNQTSNNSNHCGLTNLPPRPNSRIISGDVDASGQVVDGEVMQKYAMSYDYSQQNCSSNPCFDESNVESIEITIKFLRSSALNFWDHSNQGLGIVPEDAQFTLSFNLYKTFVQFKTFGPNANQEVKIQIPVQYLNNGLNNIALSTFYHCYNNTPNPAPMGLHVEGYITITTKSSLNKADGTSTNQFCVGEDIFFNGESINASSYDLELYSIGSNTPLKTVTGIVGSPNMVNIKKTLSGYTILPGQNYTVKIKANTECGEMIYKEDFTYLCCSGSYDSSFDLSINGSTLVAESSDKDATHTWEVFKTNNVATGPYSLYNTSIGSILSLTSLQANNEHDCYMVKHTKSNSCISNTCTIQTACRLSCETADCIGNSMHETFMPSVTFNPIISQNKFWVLPISFGFNVSSFMIEIVPNSCCADDVGGVYIDYSQYAKFINVPTNISSVNGSIVNHIYIPDLNNDLPIIPNQEGPINCYSFRYYAVCSNGELSRPSRFSVCVFNPF